MIRFSGRESAGRRLGRSHRDRTHGGAELRTAMKRPRDIAWRPARKSSSTMTCPAASPSTRRGWGSGHRPPTHPPGSPADSPPIRLHHPMLPALGRPTGTLWRHDDGLLLVHGFQIEVSPWATSANTRSPRAASGTAPSTAPCFRPPSFARSRSPNRKAGPATRRGTAPPPWPRCPPRRPRPRMSLERSSGARSCKSPDALTCPARRARIGPAGAPRRAGLIA